MSENTSLNNLYSSTYNPQAWLKSFRKASINQVGFRELRKEIFEDTVKIVLHQKYIVDNHEVFISKDFLKEDTQLYVCAPKISKKTNSNKTIFHVIEVDCLEIASLLLKQGFNPCVLNMANRQNPGGGVQNGAGAQEENIFRRSNIYRSLYQFAPYAHLYELNRNEFQTYPLNRETGGVYSKDVTVFRGSETQGYPFLKNPFKISVVSVPAINSPSLIRRNNSFYITDDLVEPTKDKIRTILRIAALNNHNSIILGALGCGAFKNPPNHIAELFKAVFNEDEFLNFFQMIIFSIIEDHNSNHPHNPEGNLIPFKRVFP